jgi:hypothetical protein
MSLRRTIKVFAAGCLGTCLLPGLGATATFHVSPFGSSTLPYDTYAKAATKVKDAVDASSGLGDTVFIHSGTYDVDTTIDLPRGAALRGVGRDSVSLVYRGNCPVSAQPGQIK